MRKVLRATPFWLSAVLVLVSVAPLMAVAAEKVVTVTAAGISPAPVEVAVGDSVRWVNQDAARHRFRTSSGPEGFDIDLDPGASGSFTFTLPGTYQYGDERNRDNPSYRGTIVVAGDVGGGGATGNEIRMANRVFTPGRLSVPVGTTVTFLNDDGRDHTATDRAGAFDSGTMRPGAAFQQTFATDATYEYFCVIHPDMVGSIVVGSGGGGAAPPPPLPPVAGSGDVQIVDFGYTPSTLTVAQGAAVSWVNTGVAPHTVTASSGVFDSGILSRGATFSRTFTNAGTFSYFCTLHPDMKGTILVTGADGAPPPPEAPPLPPPPVAVSRDVSIFDFGYNPASKTVPVGTTVKWVNNGVAPHTVTDRALRFDSGLLGRGDVYRKTFTTPGTYEYFCSLHPNMVARIVVPDASGSAPPPAPPPPSPPPPAGGDIQVIDFAYTPADLSVPVGTTLTWVNTGVALHTVTDRAGRFDSGFMNIGDSFVRTFSEPGTYEYFCTIHPDMVGLVTVADGSGIAPPAPETSSPAAVVVGSGEIAMADFTFTPQTVTVEAGTSLAWVNAGAAMHTVTANDGSFDSGFKATGERFEMSFDAIGRFDYFCVIHPQMTGTVIVVAAAGDAASAIPGGGPGAGTYLAYGFLVIVIGGMVTGMVLLKRGLSSP